jgi:hypothetical protein
MPAKGQSKPTTKVVEQLISKDDTDTTVGLLSRPFDLAICFFYIAFTWTTALIDYHNVLAPALGQTIRELGEGKTWRPLNWPPQFVTDIYMIWGETVDPMMIENPIFWQIMEWINVVFLAPGNLIMLYAFVFGRKNFRAFGLIHASALLYSMFLCLGCGLYGEIPASDKLQFTIIYSLYATFPIAIIARLWPEVKNIFSKEAVAKKNIYQVLLQWLVTVHTIFFLMWCYHWLTVNYEPMKDYQSWMPHAKVLVEKSNSFLRTTILPLLR